MKAPPLDGSLGHTGEWVLEVPSLWGGFYAVYRRAGLRAIYFPQQAPASINLGRGEFPSSIQSWHAMTCRALKAALQGRQARRLPPLDWSGATDFQQAVWRALMEIPCGEVRTYAEVARGIGRPRSARAVGAACGANPVPLLVPCHRVVGAGGRLGGFSAGLEWKVRLLKLEGHKISPPGRILC